MNNKYYKRDSLINIKKEEYIKRLTNLVPDCLHKEKHLIVTAHTVKDASELIQEIACELFGRFAQMVDTDLVEDVKEASKDIYTLGKFLDIAFETILMTD